MNQSNNKNRPAIQGLKWHRTQYYSFFLPSDWYEFSWGDDRIGLVFGPEKDDTLTVFGVAIKDLGMPITADDLDILAEGFFESVEKLPACDIEVRDQKVAGKQLQLEAKYTFREQETTRKCWQRIVYHETRQIVMTAQGSTTEKYEYWLPWFFEAMMTVRIHSQLPESPNIFN